MLCILYLWVSLQFLFITVVFCIRICGDPPTRCMCSNELIKLIISICFVCATSTRTLNRLFHWSIYFCLGIKNSSYHGLFSIGPYRYKKLKLSWVIQFCLGIKNSSYHGLFSFGPYRYKKLKLSWVIQYWSI